MSRPRSFPARGYVASALLPILLLAGCGGDSGSLRPEVRTFLDGYTSEYVRLHTESAEAEWASNTRIVEGDDTNLRRTEAANRALAEFTGSEEVIERTRRYLERRDELEPLQVLQLERILYMAADNPQTVPELVNRRITVEARQNERLYGFEFRIDDEAVTANDIDRALVAEDDLDRRLATWAASKEVGRTLREGLVELVDLRNRTVQALGYDDYFQYQVSDYGMTVDEMMELNRQLVRDVWPLYRELHTWARHELAGRYGAEVPEMLPAHWLPNRWGQDWTGMLTVEGLDFEDALEEQGAEWMVRRGEEFFVSLGFEPLPDSFYELSSLYPLPADAPYKKNNHASAWHMDLGDDVRSLMSVEPTEAWWATVHHELGHIFYYQAYTRPEVPPLLRRGANRAFHEGVGSMIGQASMQQRFLAGRGLVPADAEVDPVRARLKEALDQVVFIPFSSGLMTHFEHDLYTGLLPDRYNARWWEYAERFQGMVPPSPRGEEFTDAATKTHINNDAAQYYDYALSTVILHQLHAHVADRILGQDPGNTDYYGSTGAGDFLRGILRVGATRDWRELLRETVGEDLSARAMLAYYAPLLEWLRRENAGREHTLPEEPPGA